MTNSTTRTRMVRLLSYMSGAGKGYPRQFPEMRFDWITTLAVLG